MKIKDILIPALSLLIICVITTALLAFTNSVTQPIIADLAVESEIQSRQLVLPKATEFFEDTVTYNGEEVTYIIGNSKSYTEGFIFTTTAKGYGGDIKIMTGVDTSGCVVAVEILEIDETAGLGMNAQKDSFKQQYSGKTGKILVSKGSADEGSIAALTGATITSEAVTNAVNEALEIFNTIMGGGNNG